MAAHATGTGMVHLLYGVAVESDLDLGVQTTEAEPTMSVRMLAGPVDTDEVAWYPAADDGWDAGRHRDGTFVLHLDAVADFVIDADGAAVGWWSPEAPSSLLVHLVLDHALPQALMRQGRLVLHASSLVAPGGGCYLLAGESGRGKSTLATALLQRHHHLLGDDCAVIDLGPEGPLVAAAYPGLRLHEASLEVVEVTGTVPAGLVSESSDKLRLALGSGHAWDGWARPRLGTVIVLAATPVEDGVRPVPPGEAVATLLRHSFHMSDGAERIGLFDRVASLVGACPVAELHYEHSADGLAATIARIEELVGQAPRS